MRRIGGSVWSWKARSLTGVACATLALCHASGALAEGTPAGTLVRNIASASFEVDGEAASIQSNLVSTRIGEILDVTLTPGWDGEATIPTQAPPNFALPVTLTNSGNGTESFLVKGSVPGEAKGPSVAIDVDGNGVFDHAVDIDLPPHGMTPPVPAGDSLPLLVHFPTPPTVSGTLKLSARAVTGSGVPGTDFVGDGDGGSDAIVGKTDAAVTAEMPFTLGTRGNGSPQPATLAKSQSVRAPDGSDTPIAGATITYRLELRTSGAEPLEDAEIADSIPAGTRYVPGSLRINGIAVSDAADANAAQFDGMRIRVALGDLSQPTTQVVIFQVVIL